MASRRFALASVAAAAVLLWPALADAGERWRRGGHPHGWHGWHGGPPPWAGSRRGWGGPPVVVVPPPVWRPPPVIVLPGHAVPYTYGYGPFWGYAPYRGEADLRLRLPLR
jgi:hypothetical protein